MKCLFLRYLKWYVGFVFKVIAESIEKEEDDTLLKCLIDTSESAPKFLRPQLDHILDLCMKVS
jgi:hypothetical protein